MSLETVTDNRILLGARNSGFRAVADIVYAIVFAGGWEDTQLSAAAQRRSPSRDGRDCRVCSLCCDGGDRAEVAKKR